MRKFYEDQRSMFYVVEKFVQETDPAVLALMPSFGGAFSTFESIIKKIEIVQKRVVDKITGSRIEKQEKLLKMAQLTEEVAFRIKSYAIDIDDNELLKKLVRARVSLMVRMRDSIAADVCNSMIEKAQEHLAALAPYGVTAAEITALEDARTEFLTWKPAPRSAISNRKIANGEVVELIHQGMNLLNKMDVYFSTLKYSHTVLYETYLSKRMIVDTGGRKLSLRGVIFSDEGIALNDVTVKISGLDVQTLSSAKGNFEFKKLPAGIHMAEFSKFGYESTTTQFAVVDNQRTELKIEMKKVIFGVIAS